MSSESGLFQQQRNQPYVPIRTIKEKRLRDLEFEFKQMSRVFMGISDPVIVKNLDGTVVDLNEAAELAYGWSHDELIGKSIKTLVPPERYDHVDELLTQCKAGETVKDIEATRWTKTRERKHILLSLSLIRDSSGEIRHVVSIAKDISVIKAVAAELKSSETRLRDQKNYLDTILRNMTSGVVLILPNERVEFANNAAKKLIGLDIQGQRVDAYRTLTYKADKKTILPKSEYPGIKALRGNCVQNEKIFVRTSAKPEGVMLCVNTSVLHDERGQITGSLCVFRDVTMDEVNKSLEIEKKAAESASIEKSKFLANVSHEIRTPLASIVGFAELIRKNALSSLEHQQQGLEVIERSSKHLASLIDDVLDVAKIGAGELELRWSKVSLHKEIESVVNALQEIADKKNLILNIVIDPQAPKEIITDPLRLRQILFNIVGNALKYTDEGKVTINLALSKNRFSKKLIEIRVSDSGQGIEQAKREEIFKPFFQISNSHSKKQDGTGLGLDLARKLARLLGGDVVLENSSPISGSTFCISIDADIGPQLISESERPKSAFDSDLSSVSVLVVEDSPDIQVLLCHILESAGATVTAVETGQEGIEAAGNENFDVILMDLQLPDIDGRSATTQLRKNDCKTPIIALTANAQATERKRCLAGGFNDYQIKPIQADKLIDLVSRWSILH